MKTLFYLVIFFIGTAIGLPFGWWLCRRSNQRKIDAIDAQLKLNQAKMLEMINANIRARKNFRWSPPKSGDRSVKSSQDLAQ